MRTDTTNLPAQPNVVFLDIETFGPTGTPKVLNALCPKGITPPEDHGGLSLAKGKIAVVSFGWDEEPIEMYEYRAMTDQQRREILAAIFGAPALCGHNIGFDLSFLMKDALRLGVQIPTDEPMVIDTLQLARLHHAQARQVPASDYDGRSAGIIKRESSLKWLSWYHLGVDVDKTFQQADWSGPISPGMAEYAKRDVELVRDLVLKAFPETIAAYNAVIEFEGAAVWNVAKMATRGFPVDAAALLKMTLELSDRYTKGLAEFCKLSGCNGLSVVEFRKFLLSNGIELPLTPSGTQRQCNQEVLHLLRDQHPAIALYLDLTGLKQRLDKLLNLWIALDPNTDRVHGLWTSWSAPSGRMASSKPNLLGLPKDIRGPFVGPDATLPIVVADLGQIQVRVVAKLSGCSKLCREFSTGGDVHRALAAQIHRIPANDVTPDQRKQAKAGTFGFLFGCGVETFVESQLKNGTLVDFAEAERIKTSFERAFPGVRRWQREGFEKARRHPRGYRGATIGGIPYTAYGGNQVLNYPVQAVDAVIMKLFLMAAERHGWQTLCLIHDEVVVAGATADEVRAVLEEIGTDLLDFPVTADCQEKMSWAALILEWGR